MDQIRQYLLSVLAAAILCAIIIKLSERQSSTFSIVKLTASLFLTITMLSPILKFQIGELSAGIADYEAAADRLVSEGSQIATTEKMAFIKEKTEAYVLGKANAYGVVIRVDVDINNPETLIPDQITLEGNASPYVRQLLQNCISEELGIPKENQVWK